MPSDGDVKAGCVAFFANEQAVHDALIGISGAAEEVVRAILTAAEQVRRDGQRRTFYETLSAGQVIEREICATRAPEPAAGEVERVARAMNKVREQRGGTPWAYMSALNNGRHLVEAFRAEARAAIAAMDRPGWRPIETAPKDGRRVLLWHPSWEAPSGGQWYGSDWRLFYHGGAYATQPTHWMPLPTPPEGE